MEKEIIIAAIFIGVVAGAVLGLYHYNVNNVFIPVKESGCNSLVINSYFINNMTKDEQEYLVQLCTGVNKQQDGVNI